MPPHRSWIGLDYAGERGDELQEALRQVMQPFAAGPLQRPRHAGEPGKGYDTNAAAWRMKLKALNATTQPATSQPAR